MGRAKDIVLKVIPATIANPFVKAHHYSGSVVGNSKLHFGVFLDGQLHGVMSYGPSMNKQQMIGLVEGTGWNEFMELNRMAFDSVLPRNSESRAIPRRRTGGPQSFSGNSTVRATFSRMKPHSFPIRIRSAMCRSFPTRPIPTTTCWPCATGRKS